MCTPHLTFTTPPDVTQNVQGQNSRRTSSSVDPRLTSRKLTCAFSATHDSSKANLTMVPATQRTTQTVRRRQPHFDATRAVCTRPHISQIDALLCFPAVTHRDTRLRRTKGELYCIFNGIRRRNGARGANGFRIWKRGFHVSRCCQFCPLCAQVKW